MSEQAGPDHRLERLIFFSDAVIAIAITLLIIEVHAPRLAPGEAGWSELAHLLPEFFGFALSFAVIGRFWVGHHGALATMSAYDRRLLFPNLAFLMGIVFMPFATALLSANLGHSASALLYNGTLALLAGFNGWVTFIATEGADVEERHKLRAHAVSVIIAALLAIAAVSFSPFFSQLPLATIPLWRLLILRLGKPAL